MRALLVLLVSLVPKAPSVRLPLPTDTVQAYKRVPTTIVDCRIRERGMRPIPLPLRSAYVDELARV